MVFAARVFNPPFALPRVESPGLRRSDGALGLGATVLAARRCKAGSVRGSGAMRSAVLIGVAVLASAGVANAGGYGGRASAHASSRSSAAPGGRSGVGATSLSGRGGIYNGFVAGGGYPDLRRPDLRRGAYGEGFGYGLALGLNDGYGAGPPYGYEGYGYGEGSGGPQALADAGYPGYPPQWSYGRGGYTTSGEGVYAYGYDGYAETPALPYGQGEGYRPRDFTDYDGSVVGAGYRLNAQPAYAVAPNHGWAPPPCGC